MSPDDIFAANMWPWPDPLLKRDPMGRVVFVNAAFLQLYGGRIENWAGHPVQGWPAPNPQGVPYRFETRVNSEMGEIIYDWVEVTMADGQALAIARDVTVFHQPPGSLQPVPEPAEPQIQAPAPPAFAPPAQNMAQPAIATSVEMPLQAPLQATVAIEAPAVVTAAQVAPEISPVEFTPVGTTAPETAAPETTSGKPVIQAPTLSAEPVEPDAIIDLPVEPAIASPEADNTPPERDFERRALPIEDGDAVLGSNWRDAVIARAVGAELPENVPENTPETPVPTADPASALGAHAVHQTPQEPDEDAPIGQGLHILLAEDNAINALLTRTLLEAEGCKVETVEDGALAVQAMKDNMYDLIFMDMRMPNMDGLEATRKIRAMGSRTAELPIIALTANAFDDDRNACFDSGMNDFMTKPVSAEELTHMVKTWTAKVKGAEAAA